MLPDGVVGVGVIPAASASGGAHDRTGEPVQVVTGEALAERGNGAQPPLLLFWGPLFEIQARMRSRVLGWMMENERERSSLQDWSASRLQQSSLDSWLWKLGWRS